MRWFASIRGQSFGPLEEHQVIEMLPRGVEYVQGEAGGPWLPIGQSPFAAYAQHPAPPKLQPTAQPSPVTPLQLMFFFVALIVGGLSMAYGWLGVAVGVALIVWTVVRHRRKQPSLVAAVWRKPAGLGFTILTVLLGAAFSTCGLGRIGADLRVAAAKKEAEAETKRAADAKAEAHARMVAAVPQKAQQWRARLTEARATSESGKLDEAIRLATAVADEVDAHGKAIGQPVPALLNQVAEEADALRSDVKEHVAFLEDLKAVPSQVAIGKKASTSASWIAADDAYAEALAALGRIENASAALKAKMPSDFDVAKQRSQIERLRRGIATAVAAERKRLAREEARRREEEAKAAAYSALCGERPQVSQWDGEVVGLERHVQQTAHDPDSIDVENCTIPVITGEVCWVFSCDVRGKNAFGAKVYARKRYSYSKALGFQEVEG